MSSNRSILIVEDDEIIASIYRNKFEKAGFEVEIATDGQAGFYRVHEIKPTVVLLDLMLPHMNGVEILTKIKAQKRFRHIPVFVFTNAYMSEVAHEAAEMGAVRVFNKATTTPQQIIDAVNEALGGAPVERQSVAVQTPAAPPEPPPAVPAAVVTPMAAAAVAAPPAPAVAPAPIPSSPESDAEFQANLVKNFYESSLSTISTLRKLFQEATRSDDQQARLEALATLYRKVHSMTGSAAFTGQRVISQMCSALEALLLELYQKPVNINASTLRTVAVTIDFLTHLLKNPVSNEKFDSMPFSTLVVDDESISRKAVVYALEKAKLRAISVDDPTIALKLLQENVFDLIVLDIEMPEMDGYTLCKRLREVEIQKNVPVVFVTGLSDFETKAKTTLSGGNDLIAKPFLFMELAVKALTHVLKARLAAADREEDQKEAELASCT